MLKSLTCWFGQYFHSLLLLLVLTFTVSCTGTPLSLLTGGGPNVAANVQAGQTNSQTIGTTNNVRPTVTVNPNSKVETIDQRITDSKVSTERVEKVTVNETPSWLIIALVVWSIFLWQLPSPSQIGDWFNGLFRRK